MSEEQSEEFVKSSEKQGYTYRNGDYQPFFFFPVNTKKLRRKTYDSRKEFYTFHKDEFYLVGSMSCWFILVLMTPTWTWFHLVMAVIFAGLMVWYKNKFNGGENNE